MSDEEAGLHLLFPSLQQLGLQLGTGLGVQSAEGFVHQKQAGIHGVGTGDGHALLHAAGQLLGIGIGELLQTHHFDVLHGDFFALFLGLLLELQTEFHVFLYGKPGEQGEVLEHDAPVNAGALHGLSVHQHFAGGRLQKARQNVQQRRLAAAGGTDHADKLVVPDFQIGAVQGNHRAVAAIIDLLDVLNDDLRGQISRFSCHEVSLLSKNFRVFSATIPMMPTTMI